MVDGGYTKRELLKPALQAGYVLVARLRRDAALYGLPPGIEPGQERPRGRPPVYGKDRRSLVKRAGRARGWQTATLSTLTGAVLTKPVKTSLATWRPAGGAVQGVITKEGDGSRRAVLGTDPEARVETIAQIALERGAIEENFHDVKGVEGIEPVQVRRVWSDVGALDLNPWVPTLIAVWGWGRPARALSDRSARPWDDAPRRPSHADRHKAVQRAMLEADDHRLDVPEPRSQKIRRLLESVVSLVA